jgi:hypothetical protein
VSPWLKVTVGLMRIQAVEFATRSSARSPTWRASCRCFRPATYQGEGWRSISVNQEHLLCYGLNFILELTRH